MHVGGTAALYQYAKNLTTQVADFCADGVVARRQFSLVEAAELVGRRVAAFGGHALRHHGHRDVVNRVTRAVGDQASYRATVLRQDRRRGGEQSQHRE